jgi:nucleotide-binding universal stress UspA family protein
MSDQARIGDGCIEVVLAGYDATDRATDGLRFAAAVADGSDAELVVAAALEYAPVSMLPTDDYVAARARRFEAIFAKAGETLERDFTAKELSERPAHALHDCAVAVGADVLVVGATEHAKLGRIYPGSVPHQLLQGAPCPIAVAPPAHASRVVDRVGVAFNGRDTSWEALRFARALASGSGDRIELLTVLPSHLVVEGRVVSDEEMHEAFAAQLEAARGAVGAEFEVVTTLLPRGDGTVETLLEACAGLDVLVLGSRGFGPLGRTLLGSVSEPFLRRAPIPVVVVPRPSERAAADSEPAGSMVAAVGRAGA